MVLVIPQLIMVMNFMIILATMIFIEKKRTKAEGKFSAAMEWGKAWEAS